MNTEAGPTPMDAPRAISPAGAKTYMDHKAATMENLQLQAHDGDAT